MGFSKKTGKGRLDKYYYLAKEQGYRARSAFKIKQLNQKFGFLESARVLLDLCAAPGGWLQVAAECMPMSHLIVGVDLVPIKPIKGVVTIVGDITTDKCRSDIKRELKTWKADVVLHDGAPNVGNAWIQDAFSQAELVLHSFKLASEFLVEGGVFVTKVFRSKEYPFVLAALKKYFKRVDATKPDSSRSVSAEIFVYCKGFQPCAIKADPIEIKAILSGDQEQAKLPSALTNILHPEKKRINRDGYEDNITLLHKRISLTDFLNSKEPDQILSSHNEITISTEDEVAFISSIKDAEELRLHCADLKVLGRKEFRALLKIHKAFQTSFQAEPKGQVEDGNDKESTKDNDTALFDDYKSHLRSQKKKEKKRAKRLEQSQNHLDLSFEQELADSNIIDAPEDVPKLPANQWFSNPIFKEVFDEFSREEPSTTRAASSRSTKASSLTEPVAEASEADVGEPANTPLPPIDQDEIVDLTFNRYAFDDDKSTLPAWFVEDEDRHNIPQEPMTKEVSDLLREHERLIKNRVPKKVMEAKNRLKMKALRKLQTLKKKAAVIAENEELGEGHKITQIRKLLSKSKAQRVRPKLVVSKGKLRGTKGRPRGIKGKYKMVDKRLIKDIRGQNARK